MIFSLNGVFVGYNSVTLSCSTLSVICLSFTQTSVIDVISLGLVLDSNKWHP